MSDSEIGTDRRGVPNSRPRTARISSEIQVSGTALSQRDVDARGASAGRAIVRAQALVALHAQRIAAPGRSTVPSGASRLERRTDMERHELDTVIYEKDAPIARIILNRPEKANAQNSPM